MDNSKINMHKRMAMGQKPTGMKKGGKVKKMMGGGMGGRTGEMMYSRGYGVGEKSKRMPTMIKKGGEAKKKKAMKGTMKPARRVTGTNPNRPINPTNPGFPYIPQKPRPNQKRKMMGGGVAEAARKVRAAGMKKGGLKPVNREKNPGLAKLPTRVRNKMGYMKKGGSPNTRRMNRLEELGRVDAEKAKTRRGRKNLKQEKRRIVRELKK
tara:strand:+ start:545 stop:1171 length:627 start_codon:yes stop_codon:yes gene_type:complete